MPDPADNLKQPEHVQHVSRQYSRWRKGIERLAGSDAPSESGESRRKVGANLYRQKANLKSSRQGLGLGLHKTGLRRPDPVQLRQES